MNKIIEDIDLDLVIDIFRNKYNLSENATIDSIIITTNHLFRFHISDGDILLSRTFGSNLINIYNTKLRKITLYKLINEFK